MRKTSKSRINHLAPEGFRWCNHCEKFVSKDSFHNTKNPAYCITCSREYQRERRGRNPEGYRIQKMRQRLRRFSMTVEQFEEMLDRQGGGCAICGTDVTSVATHRLSVDHDHNCCPSKESCGKCIRGILCTNCNSGLGHFKDSPELLAAAAVYLGS